MTKSEIIKRLECFREAYPLKIRGMNRKIAEMKDGLIHIKSINFDGMPRGGTVYTLADRLGDIEEIEQRKEAIKREAACESEIIFDYIDTVLDTNRNRVLTLFYVRGLSMPEIADRMHKDIKVVYRLRREAIDMIECDPAI